MVMNFFFFVINLIFILLLIIFIIYLYFYIVLLLIRFISILNCCILKEMLRIGLWNVGCWTLLSCLMLVYFYCFCFFLRCFCSNCRNHLNCILCLKNLTLMWIRDSIWHEERWEVVIYGWDFWGQHFNAPLLQCLPRQVKRYQSSWISKDVVFPEDSQLPY